MCFLFSSPFKEAEQAVAEAANAYRDYESSQLEQDLTRAIAHYHHAYQTSGEKHNQFPDIIINYAALLNKQGGLSGGNSHLEQVIRLLEQARSVMNSKGSPQMPKYGVLLNNLGQAYLDRYRASRTSESLASAKKTFEQARSQNVSSPGSSTYITSLIGSATALWTECELQPRDDGDLAKLGAAIKFLESAQSQSKDDIKAQTECILHLASVYKTSKDPDSVDLDRSIKFYSEAIAMLDSQNPNRAPTLFNLAKQHFERHKLTKNPIDLTTAMQKRDEVKALVAKLPKAEELRSRIQDLTNQMDLYEKRGLSDESEVSATPPGSRQTTMVLDTGFSVASSSRRGTLTPREGLKSITGEVPRTEPPQFYSEQNANVAKGKRVADQLPEVEPMKEIRTSSGNMGVYRGLGDQLIQPDKRPDSRKAAMKSDAGQSGSVSRQGTSPLSGIRDVQSSAPSAFAFRFDAFDAII